MEALKSSKLRRFSLTGKQNKTKQNTTGRNGAFWNADLELKAHSNKPRQRLETKDKTTVV